MTTEKKSSALPVAGNRFLIVGGASLVGSATAEVLLQRGAGEVILLDNFSLGSKDAVEHLMSDRRIRLVTADIMRLPQLLDAMKGVNGVLHLAAMMSISMHSDPWTGLDVNIRGAQNVIEAAAVCGADKLVFASSNAVYGYGPGVIGYLREDTPFHSAGAPEGAIMYGASKIIGEQLCRVAYREHGLPYVVLRYSTVYGERQHYRAANALYIIETHDKVRRGERPQVIGDGSETKHFIYVGDLANANAQAFESDACNVAVNVSGPEPITTLELVKLVTELSGSTVEPEHVKPAAGKVRLTSGGAFVIDHALAERTIGWTPKVKMREGIGRLLRWREEAETRATKAKARA
ncbi:MAG: NAD-dependent epimerase/dehydratase family protein [Hyphomicrobiaceae bacterium]